MQLAERMSLFTKARQFRDLGVLRVLQTEEWLVRVQDSTTARYLRFRIRWPQVQLHEESPELENFVKKDIGGSTSGFVAALARAFQHVESKSGGYEAALEVLGYVYQFPPRSIVISASSHTFARSDGKTAVYYLSEEWTIPLDRSTVPKRFTVEWYLSRSGQWMLNQVK